MIDPHPLDPLLRAERIPHIWCAGCGIGSTVEALLEAVEATELPADRLAVVSGIGCSGRVAGYLNVDSFHTTHGRPIPFATGLKIARPEMTVIVVSGDGDLAAIGGNHLVHAARRNMDLLVICINNFNYGMTGGQAAPTTPLEAWTTTSPRGCVEEPFNLVDLMACCGAPYVARWISMDVRRTRWSIERALGKPGFRFIEVISPCPINYGRRNEMPGEADQAHDLLERCVVSDGADTREARIGRDGPILCGTFVDGERPGFVARLDALKARAREGGR